MRNSRACGCSHPDSDIADNSSIETPLIGLSSVTGKGSYGGNGKVRSSRLGQPEPFRIWTREKKKTGQQGQRLQAGRGYGYKVEIITGRRHGLSYRFSPGSGNCLTANRADTPRASSTRRSKSDEGSCGRNALSSFPVSRSRSRIRMTFRRVPFQGYRNPLLQLCPERNDSGKQPC